MRIGHGIDVHKLVSGRELILGGILIKHNKGLLGHSDADVLTHAIMDSLIGAMALGDIGKLFPDTSSEFKDISSIILLKEVISILYDKGYKIINIDATVIAQEPKLAPFIMQMRKNLADAMRINIDDINIKATTEEGLGFTGSGEGICSHCVSLISKYSLQL